MKMPLSWAQSYAPFTCTPAEFAAKMTMSGSKVEGFESEADHMSGVVVGRIAQIERHPDSDHLWVCQVDVGSPDGAVQIVTGAQNLKGGELCPTALHGAKLPNGMEIKKGKLRGLASNGMLCSLAELGLTVHDFPGAIEDGILVLDDVLYGPFGGETSFACSPKGEQAEAIEDGILVLDGAALLGSSAAVALGMDEVVFEFEITPNRPDCLSLRGLAREAAATFGVPFADHVPLEPAGSGAIEDYLAVQVECPDTCLRYAAAMVENVRVAPSPRWLRQRLRHAGVRPINNIVDITNYVMLEYGQPMHAFDHAYVNGQKITVRRAKAGESIVTLDGTERPLTEEMMVIADERGPIAIAGIMGGEYSGVYDTTQKVVFESASFDGPSVRATSKKIGLRTESSTRFEKGLDPNTAGAALRRALELVKELDAGDIVGGLLDDYPAPRKPHILPLQPDVINRILGIEIAKQRMIDILRPLGFEVEDDRITIPTSRADVARDCDIAEEVARFEGYNSLPSTILRGAAQAMPTPRQRFDEKCVDVLVGSGLWQCETFSFYSPKSFDAIHLPKDSPLRDAVKIMNPFGEDTSIMRSTALPSILEVAARNWAARAESCAVFEQATEYRPTHRPEDLPLENQKLVMAAYGSQWDYLALKGVAEALLLAAGVARWEVRRNTEGTIFHPGRCADLYVLVPAYNEMLPLGSLGEVHPAVMENYDIRPRVVAADLSLDVLFSARGGTVQTVPLPKFPAITRDLALVMQDSIPAAEVALAIRSAAGKRLESLSLFDIYTGGKIGAGKKSLAYNLVLRDADATLTDADADAIINKVLKKLQAIDVVLRS